MLAGLVLLPAPLFAALQYGPPAFLTDAEFWLWVLWCLPLVIGGAGLLKRRAWGWWVMLLGMVLVTVAAVRAWGAVSQPLSALDMELGYAEPHFSKWLGWPLMALLAAPPILTIVLLATDSPAKWGSSAPDDA